MVNSNAKGKRFEREVAHWLRSLGFEEARRTAQVDGGLSADVIADGLHVECKHYKQIGAMRFMDQAVRDKMIGDIPTVVMRENDGEKMVMVRAEDLVDFAKLIVERWLDRKVG